MGLERLLVTLAPRTRVRRLQRVAGAGWLRAPRGTTFLPDRYFIRHGYTSREVPDYSPQTLAEGEVWQPDVYPEVARLAGLLSCGSVVDVGCGNGRKLVALHPRFDIVGIDFGSNLEQCRAHFPYGSWIEHDLETDGPLPVEEERLRDSVVVCADTVEHLVRPERLLAALRGALELAPCVVISTPERELTWGVRHLGPPPNTAHVREWALAEFAGLLRAEGFAHGALGLTRSRDRFPQRNTILALLFADAARLERCLR